MTPARVSQLSVRTHVCPPPVASMRLRDTTGWLPGSVVWGPPGSSHILYTLLPLCAVCCVMCAVCSVLGDIRCALRVGRRHMLVSASGCSDIRKGGRGAERGSVDMHTCVATSSRDTAADLVFCASGLALEQCLLQRKWRQRCRHWGAGWGRRGASPESLLHALKCVGRCCGHPGASA